MQYWLMKSEPDEFSIHDLKERPRQTEPWTGVRNYQARNNLNAMKPGDRVLFHHSSVSPAGIAGLAEVVSEAFPDPSALDPQSDYFDAKATPEKNPWRAVNVRFVKVFPRLLSLDEMREIPGLEKMLVLKRGMRLSVQPVSGAEYRAITAWMQKANKPVPRAAPRSR